MVQRVRLLISVSYVLGFVITMLLSRVDITLLNSFIPQVRGIELAGTLMVIGWRVKGLKHALGKFEFYLQIASVLLLLLMLKNSNGFLNVLFVLFFAAALIISTDLLRVQKPIYLYLLTPLLPKLFLVAFLWTSLSVIGSMVVSLFIIFLITTYLKDIKSAEAGQVEVSYVKAKVWQAGFYEGSNLLIGLLVWTIIIPEQFAESSAAISYSLLLITVLDRVFLESVRFLGVLSIGVSTSLVSTILFTLLLIIINIIPDTLWSVIFAQNLIEGRFLLSFSILLFIKLLIGPKFERSLEDIDLVDVLVIVLLVCVLLFLAISRHNILYLAPFFVRNFLFQVYYVFRELVV